MQVFSLLSLTESTDGLGRTEKGGFVGLPGLALSAELQSRFYDQLLQTIHLCFQLIRSLVLILILFLILLWGGSGGEGRQPLLQSGR